jgi:hypothetical protein
MANPDRLCGLPTLLVDSGEPLDGGARLGRPTRAMETHGQFEERVDIERIGEELRSQFSRGLVTRI